VSFIGLILIVDCSIFGLGNLEPGVGNEVATLAGVLVAFGGAGGTSLTRIFIGKNAGSLNGHHNLLWSGAAVGVVGVVLNLGFEKEFEWFSGEEVWWVVSNGVFSGMIQYSMVEALRYVSPGTVSVIANLQVLWIFMLDIFVEMNDFSIPNFVGACLIILATVIISSSSEPKAKEPSLKKDIDSKSDSIE
jgi:drug/metabolite transporter (DMT)-like permease